MYLNTLFNLFKKRPADVEIKLPLPVTLALTADTRIIAKYNEGTDNRVLIYPLALFEQVVNEIAAIAVMSERVGASLNGTVIEVGIQEIYVVGDTVHIPFFALAGFYPLGAVESGLLKLEII